VNKNKTKPFEQITESDKSRAYCRICHVKKRLDKYESFNYDNKECLFSLEFPRLFNETIPDEYIHCEIINEYTIEQKRNEIEIEMISQEKEDEAQLINQIKIINTKWKKLYHKFTEPRIQYQISKTHSVLLWPWEMTIYQKFKYTNPKYRDSFIFIQSKLEEFQENYLCIE